MNGKILLPFLLLPSLAHAVICKTVGEDGVVSFTDVPASECPPGSRMPDYTTPATPGGQAQGVDADSTGSKTPFTGYQSISITSPADDGTVRSNEGKVPVITKLEPVLQQNHFITLYLDGRAFRGRYGSTDIELTGVAPGIHRLRAVVIDSSGRPVIESSEVTFTLHRAPPRIHVDKVTRNQDTPGMYRIEGTFTGSNVKGIDVADTDVEGSEVIIRFPTSGKTYKGTVDAEGGWKVDVPHEPAEAFPFEVVITTPGGLKFEKSESSHPVDADANPYRPSYTPKEGGIPTTPGKTNPDFEPKYTP